MRLDEKKQGEERISCMKCKSLLSAAIILGVLTLGVIGFSSEVQSDAQIAIRNAT
jgi:hypothetical protein|nr:hypothetical protein [Bacillus licheniformis]